MVRTSWPVKTTGANAVRLSNAKEKKPALTTGASALRLARTEAIGAAGKESGKVAGKESGNRRLDENAGRFL